MFKKEEHPEGQCDLRGKDERTVVGVRPWKSTKVMERHVEA